MCWSVSRKQVIRDGYVLAVCDCPILVFPNKLGGCSTHRLVRRTSWRATGDPCPKTHAFHLAAKAH